jgi:hypothetical protein
VAAERFGHTGLVGQDPEVLSGQPVRLARPRDDERQWRGDPDAVERHPTLTWPSRRTIVLVVVAALLVAAGAYADGRVRRHEGSALASCHRVLTSVSREYDVRMGAMFDYAKPTMTGAAQVQADLLRSLMARPAQHVLPSAQLASQRCAGVHPLPWHAALVARKDAYLAYGTALVDRLQHVATARERFQIEDGHLSRLRAAAGIPAAVAP